MTAARTGSMAEGYAETYRGHTLTRAWAGHVNVTHSGGFCGGFKSFAAARRTIDAALDAPPIRYRDEHGVVHEVTR